MSSAEAKLRGGRSIYTEGRRQCRWLKNREDLGFKDVEPALSLFIYIIGNMLRQRY